MKKGKSLPEAKNAGNWNTTTDLAQPSHENLNSRSTVCVAIVLVSLSAMHVTPVLYSIGAPLAIVAVSAAVLNPFSAFAYLAASQIAPDPPNLPLTLAQLFVAAWVLFLPLSGCLKFLPAVSRGMKFMLPFIFLWLLVGIVNRTISMDWVYGFVTFAILCTYLPMAKGRYKTMLWMLALGASLGILGYWGNAVGLPMEGKVYEHSLRGGLRMGSGRADVNFASVNIGFGLWTICALLASTVWLKRNDSGKKSATKLLISLCLFGAPLIATGSRGGIGYLVFGALALSLYLLNMGETRNRFVFTSVGIFLFSIPLMPSIWILFTSSPLGEMLLATLDYNSSQAELVGSHSISAGRSDIWGAFMKIALDYPMFGAPQGARLDMGEYGVAILGEEATSGNGAGGTGHNVFIDIAAGRGFPTAILFAVGFCLPVLSLIKNRGKLYAMPFVIAHVMVFLPFMNLSIGNWKTFWALNALTAYAALTSEHKNRLRRKVNGSK